MKKLTCALTVSVLSLSLIACTNQDAGTLTGGAVGGLIGSQFGSGSGKIAAMMGGALIGAFIGNRIGKSMDIADQRRMNAAIASGEYAEWRNPENGNRYMVDPGDTYYQGSQACREYSTTGIIGGKKQQVYGRACQTSDGAWRIVS